MSEPNATAPAPPAADAATLAVHVVPTPHLPINVVETLQRAADGRPAAEPRFEALHAWARSHVRMVGAVGEADLVLYPGDYRLDKVAASRAADAADRAGRTCLFFDAGDTWTPFTLPRGIYYRASCDRRTMRHNEAAMPVFAVDGFDEARRLSAGPFPHLDLKLLGPAPHGPEPTVGFCGYVGTPLSRAVALATGQVHKWRGLALRERLVRTLRRRAPGVRFDAATRATFGGAAITDAGRRAARVEFFASLLANAYTLCLRGKGNFSFRFYEVLSSGRIPLFVDTRCVLPFEDEIEWRSLLAWCDEADVPRVGEIVRAFHARFDAATFAAHQARLRALWQSHLSPLGFVQQLVRRHAFRA